MQKLLITIIVLLSLILGIGIYGLVTTRDETTVNTPKETAITEVTEIPSEIPTEIPTATPEPTIDPSVFTDTESVLILANKKHKLPDGYVPSDLVTPNITMTQASTMKQIAADAISEMAAAATEDGVTLKISSAYRSEDYQSSLYYGYVSSYGTETADTISSRPGYSDHQTGLAADFVEGDGSMNGINFNQSFEDTDSGNWLREHAHEYGFIMRYPKGKQDITGYAYEPWHFRYVGVEYATKIWEVDEFESFEEYFEVEGGDYAD